MQLHRYRPGSTLKSEAKSFQIVFCSSSTFSFEKMGWSSPSCKHICSLRGWQPRLSGIPKSLLLQQHLQNLQTLFGPTPKCKFKIFLSLLETTLSRILSTQASASLVVTSTVAHLNPGTFCSAKCSETSWVGLTSWVPNFLKPVRQIQSNIVRINIFQQYIGSQYSRMLKFKQIKNSIIHHKGKNNVPQMEQSTQNNNCSPLTFKTIGKEFSPLRKFTQPADNAGRFQTDKKQTVSPFRQENYKSDAKENSSRNVYFTKPPNFSDLSFKKLEFAAQPKRKCHPIQPSLYTDQQIQRKNSKGTLSFANLLQSKIPSSSKGKCYIQSERKEDRESSISKLKQKLFGMKRLISQKEDKVPIERPSIKKQLTNRDMNHSPYKLDSYEEDLVKVSIKEDSFPHQLDMAPFLR